MYLLSISQTVKKAVQSKFDAFWLNEINKVSLCDNDPNDHNKLRFYKTFKASFKIEPYLEIVSNRNQRCHLTRMRISAHNLAVEKLRYCEPKVRYDQRYCRYCSMEAVDSEIHFLRFCDTFFYKRQCLLGRLSALNCNFPIMSPTEQVMSMLCPTNPQAAKSVNKYIKILFKARENIDNGYHISTMTFSPQVVDYVNTEDLDSSVSSCESSFSSNLTSDNDELGP